MPQTSTLRLPPFPVRFLLFQSFCAGWTGNWYRMNRRRGAYFTVMPSFFGGSSLSVGFSSGNLQPCFFRRRQVALQVSGGLQILCFRAYRKSSPALNPAENKCCTCKNHVFISVVQSAGRSFSQGVAPQTGRAVNPSGRAADESEAAADFSPRQYRTISG